MSKIDDLMQQGLQLHQSGRIVEAEAIYAKVLSRQPSHPAANHLGGLALLQRGDAAGAIARLQRAVRMRSNDPDYLGNLGTALNTAGRAAEAVEAFDKAIGLRPQSPGFLNNRGMALKSLSRFDESVTSFRSAIQLAPNEAGFHRNLANTLGALGDWHGAADAYRHALQLLPNFPNALTGLCNALEGLQQRQEAIVVATDYAARFPAESEIWRALGRAHWLAGDPGQAANAYRRAILASPADAEAHRMLGLIVPRVSAHDPEVAAVSDLLARPDLSADQRAQLEFTLGQAFSDAGEGGRALAAFQSANARLRELHPFSLAAAEARAAALRQAFESLDDSDVPDLRPANGPIFIVGLPRSGKTTLEGMLARHPELFAAGELPVLANVAAALGNDGKDSATAASIELATELGRRYLAMAERLAPGRRIIDTMPNNLWLVGAIRLAIPTARVISCHRSPEHLAAAMHQKYFALSGNEYACDLADALAFAKLNADLQSFWNSRFPGLLSTFDVSDLGRDADLAMRMVSHHLGLTSLPGMKEPFISEPRLRSSPPPRDAASPTILAAIAALDLP